MGPSATFGRTVGVLCAVLWLWPAAVAAGGAVQGGWISDQEGRTRYVLELSRSVEFEVFQLAEAGQVVVSLSDMDVPATGTLPTGSGLITRQLGIAGGDGSLRIVMDVSRPVEVADAFMLPPVGEQPFRFVLDLRFPGAIEPADRSAPDPSIGGEVQPFVIVLDPGHGGQDPGAVGAGEIYEKDVTLAVARSIRDGLEALGGFAVVMTRDEDVFVTLPERVAIARRAHADLMLSIHADSNRYSWVRGASVYTLSDRASDGAAAQLAERENSADEVAGIALGGQDEMLSTILVDLALRQTRSDSNLAAQVIVESLAEQTQLLTNSHRQAGFRVLTAPDVPSALVELGYLSNGEEGELLSAAEHQADLAAALTDAIVEYASFARATVGPQAQRR